MISVQGHSRNYILKLHEQNRSVGSCLHPGRIPSSEGRSLFHSMSTSSTSKKSFALGGILFAQVKEALNEQTRRPPPGKPQAVHPSVAVRGLSPPLSLLLRQFSISPTRLAVLALAWQRSCCVTGAAARRCAPAPPAAVLRAAPVPLTTSGRVSPSGLGSGAGTQAAVPSSSGSDCPALPQEEGPDSPSRDQDRDHSPSLEVLVKKTQDRHRPSVGPRAPCPPSCIPGQF